ncbi:MAG: hypothetical protein WC699_13510 [Bacteroidales bacterium]|jgi:hypothetical protein
MKTKKSLFLSLMILTLTLVPLFVKGQVGNLTQTGNVTVCLGTVGSYGVMSTAGSTYTWTLLAGSGGTGSITAGPDPNNMISVTWTSSGTCTLQVIESSATCSGEPVTIQVTISPALLPGIASADQAICYNSVPVELSATAPTGGNGSFTYQWEVSSDAGTTWVPVAGASNLTYQPEALKQTVQYHLIQTSEGSCGVLTTNSVTLTVGAELVTSPIYHD